jgi:IclR family KDG regulon transcriptional repressor
MELERFTPNTITDMKAFRKTLGEIKKRGYSVDEQDFELGAYAFGAPVYDHDGQVVAGISITTPTARYTPESREELIRLVTNAARRLSLKLGYQSI